MNDQRQTISEFNQLTATSKYDYQDLHRRHKEIVTKINRLEERYIEKEVGWRCTINAAIVTKVKRLQSRKN